MKVLCPQCERLGDLERYRLEGATLIVTCLKCNAETRVDAAAPAVFQSSPSPVPAAVPSAPRPQRPVSLASAPNASNVVMLRTSSTEAVDRAARAAEGDPFEVPPNFCPKCIAAKPPDAVSCPQCGLSFAQLDPVHLAPSPWLVDAWRSLLLSWGDDGKHEAVRTAALQQEELVALGRLYRIRLAVMPDDPFAQRGREEVLRLASAPVFSRIERATPERRGLKVWLAIIMLVLMLGAAALLFVRAISGLNQ